MGQDFGARDLGVIDLCYLLLLVKLRVKLGCRSEAGVAASRGKLFCERLAWVVLKHHQHVLDATLAS